MSESTGRREACPHCGVIPLRRLSLGWLKYAAVLLGAVGLLTMFLLTRQRPALLVSIGDLSPNMDSAYVHVEGTVSRQPDYDAYTGLLGFSVDDGTGELRIVVPGEEADVLWRDGQERMPRLGDRVTLDGVVLARGGSLSLTVRAPSSVSVTRAEPTLVEIGDLTADWDDRQVEVMGVVRQVRRPVSGLTIITLRDGTGVVDVVIPGQVIQLTGDLHPSVLVIGAPLRLQGVVTLWGGSPQIALTDAAGVAPLPLGLEFAPRRTVEQIGQESVGQFRKLLGVVTNTDPLSAGLEFELDDGTGVITVQLSRELADVVAADGPLEPGLRMEVVGQILGIGGAWNIIPETSADVSIVGRAELPPAPPPLEAPEATRTATPTAAPTAAPIAPPIETPIPVSTVLPTTTPLPAATVAHTPRLITPLAEISAADAGQMRTVQAEVVTVDSFSAGFRFVLNDGTGQIILLVWEDRYAGIGDRNSLRPGAILQVTGKVSEYRGELQLEPVPEDVVILEGGDGPAADLVATGQLAAFVGQVVAVQGRVVRLETFSGDSARLFVDDGSGEAQIILWHNVLELVPADLLAEGAVLHIVGEVSEYRSSVELVPALPVYLAPGVLPGG